MLKRMAKAVAPFGVSLVAAAVGWGVSGRFDKGELLTILGGAATAVIVYYVPNAKKESR